MSNEKVWMDINHNKFSLNEISDSYLINILAFVKNGRGYVDYLNEYKIRKLFKEAEERGLKHSYNVNEAIKAVNVKKRALKKFQSMGEWEML